VPLSTAHQKVLEEWMRSKAVVMCPFFTCGTFGPERGSPARAYAALTGSAEVRAEGAADDAKAILGGRPDQHALGSRLRPSLRFPVALGVRDR
jgi:hypothetical protein